MKTAIILLFYLFCILLSANGQSIYNVWACKATKNYTYFIVKDCKLLIYDNLNHNIYNIVDCPKEFKDWMGYDPSDRTILTLYKDRDNNVVSSRIVLCGRSGVKGIIKLWVYSLLDNTWAIVETTLLERTDNIEDTNNVAGLLFLQYDMDGYFNYYVIDYEQ